MKTILSKDNNFGYKFISRGNGLEIWDCSEKTNKPCFLVLDKMLKYARYYKTIEDAFADTRWQNEVLGGN